MVPIATTKLFLPFFSNILPSRFALPHRTSIPTSNCCAASGFKYSISSSNCCSCSLLFLQLL